MFRRRRSQTPLYLTFIGDGSPRPVAAMRFHSSTQAQQGVMDAQAAHSPPSVNYCPIGSSTKT
jgi:hypothetical protein